MRRLMSRLMRLIGKRTCEDVVATLNDYFDHSLDPETADIIERHLQNCPDCEAFAASYEMLVQLAGELVCEDIPEEVQDRVMHALEERARRG